MRIKDNPFYILDVSAYDNAETIVENEEDKAFFDDGNASMYENARTILTSPNKRLGAEVRWFYNDKSRVLKSIKQHTTFNDSSLSYREKYIFS